MGKKGSDKVKGVVKLIFYIGIIKGHTITSLCSKAGISRHTFYNYKNKGEALLEEKTYEELNAQEKEYADFYRTISRAEKKYEEKSTSSNTG